MRIFVGLQGYIHFGQHACKRLMDCYIHLGIHVQSVCIINRIIIMPTVFRAYVLERKASVGVVVCISRITNDLLNAPICSGS